ncbi:MAG: hypothetical protein ACI4HM_02210 [Ruminococcus sp.]
MTQLRMEIKGENTTPTIIKAIINLLNGDCLTRNAKKAMRNAER